MLPNKSNTFLSDSFRTVILEVFAFDGDKGNWYFSFDLIMRTNNNCLCNVSVLHENFLHLSCRKTMACSIDNIILSSHDMEVTIFIIVS